MKTRLEHVLAHRLREAAKARKLALSHVADRAGIARSYLWLLLDAESSATLETIQRLSDVLGVAPLSLLGGDQTNEHSVLRAAEDRSKRRRARRRAAK